ncbi:MAG: RNA 2',3'-cyclic phosphodiesterase [Firmicutes bacterium]|jgi:2'-5' RNA ligase|nr:RNA 2',3'-cyclic phosphodiesterase [Bacillota bacterium]
MRVFYALTIDDSSKDKLYKISSKQRGLCSGGKFTTSSNYHLTITFVGNVSENELDKYKEVLNYVSTLPTEISLDAYSFFMKKRYILYFDVKNSSILSQLKNEIDNGLLELGFVDQFSEYVPHITIGRNIKEVKEILPLEKIVLKVKSLALMGSVNEGNGLVYKELFEIIK